MSNFLQVDNFNGAGNSLIAGQVATIGGTAAAVAGTMRTDGTQAFGSNGDHEIHWPSATPPTADYSITYRRFESGQPTDYFNIKFRHNGADFYRIATDGANGNTRLQRYVAGSLTTLATFADSLGANADELLTCTAQGAVFSMYRNGSITPIFTVTDSSPILTAGEIRVEIYGNGSNASRLKSISAASLTVVAPGAPSISGVRGVSTYVVTVSLASTAGTSAIAGYRVYKNGAAVSTITPGSFPASFAAVANAAAGTVDHFIVRAYDTSGVESADSVTLNNVTTALVASGQTYALPVVAVFDPGATGQAGNISATAYGPLGELLVAAQSVVETPAGSGAYTIVFALDAAWYGSYTISAPPGYEDITRLFSTGADFTAADRTLLSAAASSAAGALAAVNELDVGGGATAEELTAALAGRSEVFVYYPLTGSALKLFRGDDYSGAAAIVVTKTPTDTWWPTTLASVTFSCTPTPNLIELLPAAVGIGPIAGDVLVPSGGSQSFKISLTAAQTATLGASPRLPAGGYSFVIRANLSTAPKVLRSGTLTVMPLP